MELLVVTNHTWIEESLPLYLKHQVENIHVHFTKSFSSLIKDIAKSPPIDCLLVPNDLPEHELSVGLSKIRQAYPEMPILMTSKSFYKHMSHQLISLDRAGLLRNKPSELGGLMHAMSSNNQALLGSGKNPDGKADSDSHSSKRPLTPRQLTVLHCMQEGMGNKEIAAALSLSEETIKSHVIAILRSLDVKNRTQAVIQANRLGY